MPSNFVDILDTTVAETGTTQRYPAPVINNNKPVRFMASLSDGDEVVIEGRMGTDGSFQTLHTFSESGAADIYVSHETRARRSTDGAAGESTVTIENAANVKLTAHE